MSTGPHVAGPSLDPYRPLLRSRRTRTSGNDTAVAVVLAGVLIVAAAACLYGTGGMPDDVLSCPSLAAVRVVGPQTGGTCPVWREGRADVVRGIGLVGVAVVAVGLLAATRRWSRSVAGRAPAWPTVAWTLFTPVVFSVLAVSTVSTGQADDGVYPALGPVLVAAAVFVTWRCASWRRAPILRAHLLAASALAAPLVCAGTAVVEAYRGRTPERPFRVQEAGFPFGTGNEVLVILTGAVTAALFAVAVLRARSSRRPPSVWLGGVLFAASVGTIVLVFVPDLVPAWRTTDATGWDAPGPGVWLPVLLTPVALTVAVWTACATRRPEPAATSA